jgi:hypothetical protein
MLNVDLLLCTVLSVVGHICKTDSWAVSQAVLHIILWASL